VAISLFGKSIFVTELRALTCVELFLNAGYYASHDIFIQYGNKMKKSLSTGLSMSVSGKASGETDIDLVKSEAINMCFDKKWASFICMIALSSVIQHEIISLYPDSGLLVNKVLFNQNIHPKVALSSNPVVVLFCNTDCEITKDFKCQDFKPNHFVPILLHQRVKRKIEMQAKEVKSKLLLQNKSNQGKKNKYFHYGEDKQKTDRSTPPLTLNFPFFNGTSKQKTFPAKLIKTESISSKLSKFVYCPSSKNDEEEKTKIETPNNLSKLLPDSTNNNVSLDLNSDDSLTHQQTKASSSLSPNLTPLIKNKCNIKNKFDVSTYINKGKNIDSETLQLYIDNVYVPPKTFSFPGFKDAQGKTRKFRYDWLKEFDWLCYSEHLKGGFCLPCVLFGPKVINKQSIEVLYVKPLTRFENAKSLLKNHCKPSANSFHGMTMILFQQFLNKMKGKTVDIAVSINNNNKRLIEENRKKVKPLIDTCVTLARCGISLRGHRDDSQYLPEPGHYSDQNIGNFHELLNYRVRGGDKDLENQLKFAPKNATYKSKTSQNEFLSAASDCIVNGITQEIRDAKFFSILADEARDCSNKEQLSLIIRYVDAKENKIREKFLGFIECNEGVTGAALAKKITDTLEKLGLDVNLARGQSYDGAGNVSGYKNGLSAHILRINDKALYTHCASHRLNLCVAESCKKVEVKNVQDKIQAITYFFTYSPQREEVLVSMVRKYKPNLKNLKLFDPCKTRWVLRIKGMNTFEKFFVPLVHTFEEFIYPSNNDKHYNDSTKSQAKSFLNTLLNFEFIIAMVISRSILDYTLCVTELLQGPTKDICEGLHLITSLRSLIQNIKCDIDNYHNLWYEKAISLAKEVEVFEKMPRICRRQIFRSNNPASTPSDYFKRNITIPVLDHLDNEFEKRFSPKNLIPFKGLFILPEMIISSKEKWRKEFEEFADFYQHDLPDFSSLGSELDQWQEYWITWDESIPNNIEETLKMTSFLFPNIKICLRILGTMPVTTCSCERSFSGLRRLKNYLRSTMTAERLISLAILEAHKDVFPDLDKILDKFLSKKEEEGKQARVDMTR